MEISAANEIATACKNGALDQYVHLYDEYVQGLYQFVIYRVQHKQTAEDLVSQIWLKALERIDTYDSQKASFKTWIYRIARNTVYDYYRTKKSEQDIDDMWTIADTHDVEYDTALKIALEKTSALLKELKPEQRDIVMLRVWDQLSFKEIAELVGKSEAACKMSFSRSVAAMREHMPGVLAMVYVIKTTLIH